MMIRRSERFPAAPVPAAGAPRSPAAQRARGAEGQFDQIKLSAPAGQESAPSFREMAASRALYLALQAAKQPIK